MNRLRIDRRTALRGLLGGLSVAVMLPPLEAMVDTNGLAFGQAQRPRRLGLWFWGNGVKMAQWRPTTTGADWAPNVSTEPLAVTIWRALRTTSGDSASCRASSEPCVATRVVPSSNESSAAARRSGA